MSKLKRLVQNSYLHLALRMFLGATFIVSAISKLPMQTRFIDVVKDYHMLPDPLAAAYGAALPWLELLIGVYLLLGILLRPSALAALFISATFMVANIGAIVKGMEHCGTCFGESFPLAAPAALALDMIMIAAAVMLLVFGHKKQKLGIDDYFEKRRIKADTSIRPEDAAI